MKASIIDLRYKMHDVLKALDRNEEVEVLYHRKKIGVIRPAKLAPLGKVKDHPFFGMNKGLSVDLHMKKLRGGRYDYHDV